MFLYLYWPSDGNNPIIKAFTNIDGAIQGAITQIAQQLNMYAPRKPVKLRQPYQYGQAGNFLDDIPNDISKEKDVIAIENQIKLCSKSRSIDDVNKLIEIFDTYISRINGRESPLHAIRKIKVVE